MNARLMGRVLLVTAALSCASRTPALAQNRDQPASESKAEECTEPTPAWSLVASAFFVDVPTAPDYVQPKLAFDTGLWHFEGRYNEEDLSTGSAWAGVNTSGGDELTWKLTPMAGAIFGRTNGIGPGFQGALGYWKLELYTEGAYVFGIGEDAPHFLYGWSQFTIEPWSWLRTGIVAERMRAHQSGRSIDRGFLVQLSASVVSLTCYLLNPDDTPIVGTGIEVLITP
jgi:hypothetical protein